MSRREAVIKAVAGAVQADSFDLTQFSKRVASAHERAPMKIRSEDAAGALAYAGMAWDDDGELRQGNPLASALLRIKYAGQWSKDTFTRAHFLLLRRHVEEARQPVSEELYAVAMAAIFEWTFDHCPRCRFRKGYTKGMRCIPCNNTGRTSFTVKRRWQLVNEYLVEARTERGERPQGIDMKVFSSRWMRRYGHFINVLRATDKSMAEGLDTQLRRLRNVAIDPVYESQNGDENRA